jgi:nitroreductase
LNFNIIKEIDQRKSIRKFDKKPVDRDVILQCVEAARLAPSADNVQPWRFLVIDDLHLKNTFGNEVFSGIYRATRWALKAPVIVVLLARLDIITNRIGKFIQKTPFYFIDVGISGEHFVLQAQSLGLGTCWIGWFNIPKAKKILNIPNNIKVCQLIALGYPDGKPEKNKRKRKDIEEIVFFNHFK